MGKRYMDNAYKSLIVTLGAYVDNMEGAIANANKLKIPKEALSKLKKSKTWGRNALIEIMQELHISEVQKLVGKEVQKTLLTKTGPITYTEKLKKGEIDKMEVVVKYKDQALRESEAIKQMDRITAVETDDLMTIISFAAASCSLCELKDHEVEGCPYRQLFLKYEAEPINCEPGDDCPYRLGVK